MKTSAICGILSFGRTAGDPEPLDGVLDELAPFGSRAAFEDVAGEGLRASVGARWTGDEPALVGVAAGDGVAAVGDIRLADHGGLAAELGQSGSTAAIALVAAAYRRWGDDCPRHLRGDFACAVVDAARGTALVFVDHAGSRPVAVHHGEGRIAFASSALALTALASVGHELDLDRVAEALALAPSPRSYVRGVTMVEAGTALAVTTAGVRSWRWWDPEAIAIDDLGSLDRHAGALWERLDAAVQAASTDASRLGVSLSGGLDSTAVAAAAARSRATEVVRTYTSVPPPGWVAPPTALTDPDESPLVRELVAAYPTLRPRFIDTTHRDLFAGHEPLWELGAVPLRNSMNAMWTTAITEEASADGVDVLLTGAAGNWAFSADGPRVLVELVRHGRLLRATHEARARAGRTGRPVGQVLRRELVDLAVGPVRHRRAPGRRSRRWLGGTALRPEAAASVDLIGRLPVLGDPDDSRWARRVDRLFGFAPMSSAQHLAVRAWWGLDTRDPTVDRLLLECALAQPEWWRRHDGIDRAVARRAMAGRVPASIVDRTRRGAQLPDWFDRLAESRESLRAELEAARDHPPSRALIDVERLTRLADAWPADGDSLTPAQVRQYRLAMVRALVQSRYLRWFESRARRVAAGGPRTLLPAR